MDNNRFMQKNIGLAMQGTRTPRASRSARQWASADGWWNHAVMYETYVGAFAGDFGGMAGKIGYLKELGIDAIHILPFFPSPMVDDGYDVADYRAVMPQYGTLKDFEMVTDRAHRAGMRVIIDFVVNHTSTRHPWFIEAASSPGSRTRDYYLWSRTGEEYPLAGNPFVHLKPKNWIYHPSSKSYYYSTFYPEQADLNWSNPEVFDEMRAVLSFWIERGVDGFRLDAISHIIKKEGTDCKSLPETHETLKKIRAYIDERHPGVMLLAEVHDTPEEVRKYFGEGDECHMAYHFALVEWLFLGLKRGDEKIIRDAAEATSDLPPNCQWATFLRNHDEFSYVGLEESLRLELAHFFDPEGLFDFGGKGISMRLASMFRGDGGKMLHAFDVLFSLPGSPVLYYGEEIGMQNEPYREGEWDTRRYVRGAFNWPEAARQVSDPNSLFNQLAVRIKARKQRL